MPSLGGFDVGVAIPHGDAVCSEYDGETNRERSVYARMGKEDFPWNWHRGANRRLGVL